jgi:phage gp45-like
MSAYDELSHLIALHAQQQIGDEVPFSIGHVIAYDPTSNEVQVVFPSFPVIDPISGAPTGQYATSPWVQLGTPWAGNGWGFQAAPEVGDAIAPFSGTQCVVFQRNRNGVEGLAAVLLYTQQDVPADTELLAGEAILRHSTGTRMKFHQNGELEVFVAANMSLTTEAGISVQLNTGGNIAITLPSGQTFSINGTGDALALVSLLVAAFNAHTHSDVQTGGGVSGTPVTSWTPSTIESAIVKVGS